MPPAKSHSQFRRNVCAICFLENGLKASRPISKADEKVIQEYICDNFSLNNEKYATRLCVECHITLHKIKKKEADSIFISKSFGQDVPPNLRSVTRCICAICSRGRLSGPSFRLEALKWKKERHNRVLFYPVSVADVDVVQPPSPNVLHPAPDGQDHHVPHEEHDDHPDLPEPAPSLETDDPLDFIHDYSVVVLNVVPASSLNNNNNNSTKNIDLKAPEVITSAAALIASPPPEYLQKNELGQTLLHLNIQRPGREDKIRDMIERGHPLEIEDNEGNTPLHEAIRHKMFDYVLIICEAGANRDHKNKAGETPLIVACKLGCLDEAEYLQYLLEPGARVDTSDCVGNTALKYLKRHLTAGRRPGCHVDYREPGVMEQLTKLVALIERRAAEHQMSPALVSTEPPPPEMTEPGARVSQLFPPPEGEHYEENALCSSCHIEIDTFDEFLNVPSFASLNAPPDITVGAGGDGSQQNVDTDPAPTPVQSSAARPRARTRTVRANPSVKRDLCSHCFSQVSALSEPGQ